jgi:hypothetical protein
MTLNTVQAYYNLTCTGYRTGRFWYNHYPWQPRYNLACHGFTSIHAEANLQKVGTSISCNLTCTWYAFNPGMVWPEAGTDIENNVGDIRYRRNVCHTENLLYRYQLRCDVEVYSEIWPTPTLDNPTSDINFFLSNIWMCMVVFAFVYVFVFLFLYVFVLMFTFMFRFMFNFKFLLN